jgi:hypothetical protein
MADKVTMTALDTFHASNVQADNLQEGDVFIATETDAKALEARGLAERGGTASKAVNAPRDDAAAARPETREEIDAERGFAEGKAISAAPANKAMTPTENAAAPKRSAKRK